MKTPLVSIIVPIYNVERYLRKCLDSLCVQTFQDWECILVDDASPDNCGMICDEYAAKDERFHVAHLGWGGVVKARNMAISIAKGKFLIFVDADDYIEPQMIELLVKDAEKHDSQVVWCDWTIENSRSNVNASVNYDVSPEEMLHRLFKDEIKGYLWNKLFRKDFWDSCKLITDESCTMMEDWFMMIQLLCNNPKMSYVNKPLYHYLVRENSASSSAIPWLLRAAPNIEHAYYYLKENQHLAADFKRYVMRAKFAYIYMGELQFSQKFLPMIHKSIRNYPFQTVVTPLYWLYFNTGTIGIKALQMLKKVRGK